MVRIAINGFGRIGRMVIRAGFDSGEDFIAVNDLTDTKTLAHLLKYDSVHGTWDKEVHHDDHSIWIDGKQLLVYSERDPSNLPWADLNIDIVVEIDMATLHSPNAAQMALISAIDKQAFYCNEKLDTYIIPNAPVAHNMYPVAQLARAQWGRDFGHAFVSGDPKGIAVLEISP